MDNLSNLPADTYSVSRDTGAIDRSFLVDTTIEDDVLSGGEDMFPDLALESLRKHLDTASRRE